MGLEESQWVIGRQSNDQCVGGEVRQEGTARRVRWVENIKAENIFKGQTWSKVNSERRVSNHRSPYEGISSKYDNMY